MRLEPIGEFHLAYTSTVLVALPYGTGEGSAWGTGSGTIAGRINGSVEWVNHPHRRSDGTFLPDARGVITTDDGSHILFSIDGRTPTEGPLAGKQSLRIFFESEAEPHRWLNNVLAVAEGVIDLEHDPPGMRALVYECVHELV